MNEDLIRETAEAAAEYFRVPSVSVSVLDDGGRASASLGCTDRTLFQIGQLSKTYICRALRYAGADEDVPVKDISPWFEAFSEELTENITLGDIMSERTGVPAHEASWFLNMGDSLDDTVSRIRYLHPAAGLRERYMRQDHMSAAASKVLGDVAGMPWDSWLKGGVLEKLGAADTYCSYSEAALDGGEDIAAPHYMMYGRPAEGPRWDTEMLAGGGSFLSSAAGLAAWASGSAEAFSADRGIDVDMDRVLGYPAAAAGITSGRFSDGWFALRFLGHDLICASGASGGSRVFAGCLPERGFSFAAAADLGGTPCAEAVGLSLCEYVIRGERSDWNLRMKELYGAASAPLRAENSRLLRMCTDDVFSSSYSGCYRNGGYGELRFREEYGRLFLDVYGIPMRVYHTGEGICVLDATELLGRAVPCRMYGDRTEILMEPECGAMTVFEKSE